MGSVQRADSVREEPARSKFRDIIEGVTMKREVDEATGLKGTVVIEHKEDLHPQIVIVGDEERSGRELLRFRPARTSSLRRRRQDSRRRPARQDAAQDREDQGHHRRSAARGRIVRSAPAEGRGRDREDRWHRRLRRQRPRQAQLILKDPETGAEEEHLIPLGKHVIVFKGDFVKKGQQLTEGPVVPHEILEVCGPQELQEHLVNEVQEVYRLQGVRSTTSTSRSSSARCCARCASPIRATPSFLWGEQIDKLDFEEENTQRREEGRQAGRSAARCCSASPRPRWKPTASSRAASFQDTTRVLTEAATLGKVDYLRGFKENVIMGHLIPAGTGFPAVREIKLVELGEQVGAPLIEEPEAQPALG